MIQMLNPKETKKGATFIKGGPEPIFGSPHDKADHLEVATSRYITHIGLLSEEVEKNKQDSGIKDQIINHPQVLSKLRDKYPSQTAEWLFLQQAVDTANVWHYNRLEDFIFLHYSLEL